MYRGFKCIAIIPAFNEQANIKKVLETVPRFLDEIIVINDGSNDDTEIVVVEHSNSDPRVKLVTNSENKGVGLSISKGYLYALEKEMELSVILAGDGQMNPNFVSKMFDLLIDLELDIVKGNRFYLSKQLIKMPIIRLVGNIILTVFNKISFRMWRIRDPQNGFVATRLAALNGSKITKIDHGYLFETEFLRMVKRNNLRIKDLNIPAFYDSFHSSLKIRKLVIPLLRIYLTELFYFRKNINE
jgi:glycosyltransferase involved in cell wall biosynthesis